MDLNLELRQEGVDPGLLEEIGQFRARYVLAPGMERRVPSPRFLYYGREIWEAATAALLCGVRELKRTA